MSLSRKWIMVSSVALCYSVAGCGGGKDDFKAAKQVNQERADIIKKKQEEAAHAHEHEHHHHAPHHGSLTMLGDHVAQIELTLDADDGKLTAYILDGEAEKALTVDQADLEVAVTIDGATEPLTLKLAPAEAEHQNEGFVAQNDKLKGVKMLKGTLTSLKLKGNDKAHEKVAIEFDAKKADADAEEAHKHGHDEHAHEKDADHKHEDKDHKHDAKDDDHKSEAGEKAPTKKASADKHDDKEHDHKDDKPSK